MSTELVTTEAAGVSQIEALRAFAMENNVRTHFFLNFNGKFGSYQTRDTDNNPVDLPLGTELAVNITDMMHGWICWVDRQRKDEIFVNLLSHPKPINADTLTDHGPYVRSDDGQRNDGWQEQIKIPMKDPITGKEYIYSTGSKSSTSQARRWIGGLAADLRVKGAGYAPVIVIQRGSFKARNGNSVPIPVFKTVKWIKLEDLDFTKPVYGPKDSDDAPDALNSPVDTGTSVEDAVVVD